MIYPQIAAKTFSRLKSDLYFRKIFNEIIRKIKKIKNPVKRARYIHDQVDLKMDDVLNDDFAASLIQCKKGCSACCHTQVSITIEEAKLLSERVLDDTPVNLQKLVLQAKAGNDYSKFMKIPYEMRGCIFLGIQNECRVYEDRPSVCRTNYVISDPKNCEVRKGPNQSVNLLKTEEADMVIYASFDYSKTAGALPDMLLKEIEKEKKSIPKLSLEN